MYNNHKDVRSSSGFYPPPSGTSHKHTSSTVSAPPEHLSEFYSFMNTKSNSSISPQQSPKLAQGEFRTKRLARQPSYNTFTSFTPSVMDLPNILTSKDFEASVESYENVLDKAENLRKALLTVSTAASEFGQALEDTINDNPKVNNTKQVSDGLINGGSLQYIVGSNNQILSRLLQQNFQEPLQKELSKLKQEYKTNHEYYQQEVKAKSKELRAKELENIRLSKSKTRNLSVYKNNLVNLTNQLDEIDRLKYDYYLEVNSLIEQFNQKQLLIRTGSMIRAELELFEGIARKGWSGGGLDKLLEISPDLFASEYEEDTKNGRGEMGSIEEDSESVESVDKDTPNLHASETLDTIRLHPPGTPKGFEEENQEDNEMDVSTPYIDRFRGELDHEDMDESFSLPKVNSESLVGSQGKEKDYSKENILDGI